MALPASDSSVPWRNAALKFTAAPRLAFGINAICTPLAKVALRVRLSMFAGVGSNASPCATASRPR